MDHDASVASGVSNNAHLISPALTPVDEHPPSQLTGVRGIQSIDGVAQNALDKHDATNDHDVFITTDHEILKKDRAHSAPEDSIELVEGLQDGRNRSNTTEHAVERQIAISKPLRKLSAAKIQELTSSPSSLPVRAAPGTLSEDSSEDSLHTNGFVNGLTSNHERKRGLQDSGRELDKSVANAPSGFRLQPTTMEGKLASLPNHESRRPKLSLRAISSPSSRDVQHPLAVKEKPLQSSIGLSRSGQHEEIHAVPQREALSTVLSPDSRGKASASASGSLPIPPLSMPTFLQLELSAERPSPLYIRGESSSDLPYESSQIKFERILNFLLVPLHLEKTLLFGALACLDAWLYTITILPLRFIRAGSMLLAWLAQNAFSEAIDVTNFIYRGCGRLWHRHQRKKASEPLTVSKGLAKAEVYKTEQTPNTPNSMSNGVERPSEVSRRPQGDQRQSNAFLHRRTKSKPSLLLPNHKADILQGLLIVACSTILMRFDASVMYHAVRGQSAIKLYVIYNGLEVCDRLFSALGQDIMECLFSRETLERNQNGRSRIFRPTWMFLLALTYSVVHATALLFQVVTLNVAVNAYSNALLTLLLSNQFVEIKGSVFKRIEKENLFQLTCADVVERFQIWLMLLVIALRNIVEMGGFAISSGDYAADMGHSSTVAGNASGSTSRLSSILPHSFTFLPSFPAQVFVPFLIVIASEMLVDWLKHAYINKFNAISPTVYDRFLDVLAKDYYSTAFAEQSLTKRLGLPVIPLSCLFIRASLQTYHMFLATNVPPPITSTMTSLSVESEASSPVSTAVLAHIDQIFREALGRSTFGGASTTTSTAWYSWTMDDVIAFATMITFFLVVYLFLLAFKLAMGISLLSYARGRYKGMRKREQEKVVEVGSKRHGQWSVVEVDEEKRKWIYDGDPEGLAKVRARDAKIKAKNMAAGDNLDKVDRYSMVAKRIW